MFGDEVDVVFETLPQRLKRLQLEHGDRCPQCGERLRTCERVRWTEKKCVFMDCRKCKTILFTGPRAVERLAERRGK